MKALVTQLEMGDHPHQHRAGVLQFSRKVKLEMGLTGEKSAIRKLNIRQLRGSNTADVFDFIKYNNLIDNHRKSIFILLTNGRFSNIRSTLNSIKSFENTHVISIGVGDHANQGNIRILASTPYCVNSFHLPKTHHDLEDYLLSLIRRSACPAVEGLCVCVCVWVHVGFVKRWMLTNSKFKSIVKG